jgi:CheY-like chemotaxis protein
MSTQSQAPRLTPRDTLGPAARMNDDVPGLSVLLVEDNPGDARLIREVLAEASHTPTRLVHLDLLGAALQRLCEPGIDVVLLDLGLPDSQGLATFCAIRAAAPRLPIVVLSGHTDTTLALRADPAVADAEVHERVVHGLDEVDAAITRSLGLIQELLDAACLQAGRQLQSRGRQLGRVEARPTVADGQAELAFLDSDSGQHVLRLAMAHGVRQALLERAEQSDFDWQRRLLGQALEVGLDRRPVAPLVVAHHGLRHLR